MKKEVLWENCQDKIFTCANTATTKILIRSETARAIADSMKKYLFACLTALDFLLSTPLDLTRAECKYKLCGIITAPITPTACKSSRWPISKENR